MQISLQTLGKVLQTNIHVLAQGRHHDPFVFLGCHPIDITEKQQHKENGWALCVWLPTAETAKVEDIELQRVEGTDVFMAFITDKQKEGLPKHYVVEWVEKGGSEHAMVSPYTFLPQLGELDLHLFAEGQHWNLYDVLGAHPKVIDGVEGVQFAVWAPSAERVSVVGDFNGWHGLRHPMRVNGGSGVWELFIPGLQAGDI